MESDDMIVYDPLNELRKVVEDIKKMIPEWKKDWATPALREHGGFLMPER